jgi:exodeoxyribonuclease V beta subunit
MLEAWREARLAAREQFTFDDLISRVHARATAPRGEGEHLADRLHAQWPVSLIDEFQDTDARQWAIFDSLHRDPAGASRACCC